jgi:hypothetical protein
MLRSRRRPARDTGAITEVVLADANMTSFITTMFVPSPSPKWRLGHSTPLPPICTHSSSSVQFDGFGFSPTSPQSSLDSPLLNAFKNVLSASPASHHSFDFNGDNFSPSSRARAGGVGDISSVDSHVADGVPLSNCHLKLHEANHSLHDPLAHSNSRSRNAFKPQKANRGTSSWQLKQFAEATLGSGSLRKAVKLPEGEDRDEWLAVNGAYSRNGRRQRQRS